MEPLLRQLKATLRGIWLRRFWGLGAAWLVAVVGLTFALLRPAEYEATARVYVDTDSVLKPLMAGLAVQPNVAQQVEMLGRTLMSRPNLERLIEMAQLDKDAKTERERQAVMERVIDRIRVTGSKSDLFSLSYRDTDPARAQKTVESLLSIFMESGISNKRRDTDKARKFLDEQIKEYEHVLSEAERRLKDFKLQNFEHLGAAQDSVAGMVTLDAEIDKARTELQAAEQRRDAIRRQLDGEVPVFLAEQVDARREALQRNLDELLLRYTEEHPDVVNARRLLAELDQQRQAALDTQRRGGRPGGAGAAPGQPNVAYQQLKVALAQADGTVAELRTKFSALQERYNRVRASAKLKPELEEQLAQLNREYLIQKNNFEQLVTRRESAKLTGELDESSAVDFKIVDPPHVPASPIAPNRPMLIVAVFFAAIAAGLGVSYLMAQFYPTIASVRDLQAVVERPVLGMISYQMTGPLASRRRRSNILFAGAVSGLGLMFGMALSLVILTARLG